MANPPLPSAARERRIARLDRMANTLDSRFRLPIPGVRFGWDSILGLIPGVGDVVTAGPGAMMIYEGARMGVPRSVLLRMGLNTGVDMVIGAIPLIGDAFDVYFKSHRRNMALLKREVALIDEAERKRAPSPGADPTAQSVKGGVAR